MAKTPAKSFSSDYDSLLTSLKKNAPPLATLNVLTENRNDESSAKPTDLKPEVNHDQGVAHEKGDANVSSEASKEDPVEPSIQKDNGETALPASAPKTKVFSTTMRSREAEDAGDADYILKWERTIEKTLAMVSGSDKSVAKSDQPSEDVMSSDIKPPSPLESDDGEDGETADGKNGSDAETDHGDDLDGDQEQMRRLIRVLERMDEDNFLEPDESERVGTMAQKIMDELNDLRNSIPTADAVLAKVLQSGPEQRARPFSPEDLKYFYFAMAAFSVFLAILIVRVLGW